MDKVAVERRRLEARGDTGVRGELMVSGGKGAIAPRRGERTGERTGVTGEAAIMALSTFGSMLRSIRNGLRSLPLGRT